MGHLALTIIVALALFSFFVIVTYEIIVPATTATNMPDAITAVPLENDRVFEQSIDVRPDNPVKYISIMFGTYKRNNHGHLTVRLYEDDREISSWRIMTSSLHDNEGKHFQMETPFLMKQDSVYRLTISETYHGNNAVALWTSDGNPNGYTLDGVLEPDGTACYSLGYTFPYLKVFLIVLIAYVALVTVAVAIFRRRAKRRRS